MVSPAVEAGDEIWAIPGSEWPFVLRAGHGGGAPIFRFLGDAYVHGIMRVQWWESQHNIILQSLMIE